MEIKSVTDGSVIDLQQERDKKKEKAKLDPSNKDEPELLLADQLKSYIEKNTNRGLKGFFIITIDEDGNIESARGISNTLNKLELFSLLGMIQYCQNDLNREMEDDGITIDKFVL